MPDYPEKFQIVPLHDMEYIKGKKPVVLLIGRSGINTWKNLHETERYKGKDIDFLETGECDRNIVSNIILNYINVKDLKNMGVPFFIPKPIEVRFVSKKCEEEFNSNNKEYEYFNKEERLKKSNMFDLMQNIKKDYVEDE